MSECRSGHVHLRSPDPDATVRFFETTFGAEVTRLVYPPGTLYAGEMRVRMTGVHPDQQADGEEEPAMPLEHPPVDAPAHQDGDLDRAERHL